MLIITVELCFLMLQALCSAVHKIPFLVGGYFSSRKTKVNCLLSLKCLFNLLNLSSDIRRKAFIRVVTNKLHL